MDTAVLEQTLRGAGLKVTRGRVAVLEALAGRPHADAETVFQAVLTDLPGTSIQNVHNELGDLAAAGLLRRIEPAGSAARYERRTGDNHHHVVCTVCGAVADVDCVVGQAPCLHPSDAAGYAIGTAEVTFWGVCPSCQERADRAPGR
jgi:Fur family ferric uptake transcriptional regulator